MRTETETWKSRGTCRTNKKIDPDLFFTTDEFRSPKTKKPHLSPTEKLAMEICGKCPVSGNCLKFALDNPRLLGIWGGTTTDMRKALRKVRLRSGCVRCVRRRLIQLDDGTQVCTACGLTYMAT